MSDVFERHPNLTTWGVLAIGMLVVLAWSARDVALNTGQWLFLALAVVILAGLCAWIISWEADEPDDEDLESDERIGGADDRPDPESPGDRPDVVDHARPDEAPGDGPARTGDGDPDA